MRSRRFPVRVIGIPLLFAATSCNAPEQSAARSVDLSLQWTVGDDSGEENLVCSTDAMLAAGPARRHFYLAPVCEPGQVAVLDASGVLAGIIGTLGQGPGELRPVGMIFAGADDRLHVFQMPRGHAVFAADQGFVSASEKLPISFWNLFLGDGRSVRNAVRRPEERRHTLHLVDDDNEEIVTSFAAIDQIEDASDGRNIWRSIATASGETFWAAHHFEFRIDEWDLLGNKLRTIERDTEWWISKPDYQGTVISDIIVRDGHQLWVLAHVPTFEGDALPSDVGADPELNRYYDTVIEVIDLNTGQVIGRLRRDELMPRWVGNMTWSYRDVGNGIIAMDVWQVELGNEPAADLTVPESVQATPSVQQVYQRDTMVRMRAIATANETMRARTGKRAATLDELKRAGYLEDVPLTDGWGSPFTYVLDGDSWTLVSYGSDGIAGPRPPDEWMLEPYEADIVMVDRLFTEAPKGQ